MRESVSYHETMGCVCVGHKLNVRQSHGENRYTFMKYSRGDWNKILKNTQLKKQ